VVETRAPSDEADDTGASQNRRGLTPRLAIAIGVLFFFTGVGILVGLLGEPSKNGGENAFQTVGGATGWASLSIAIGVVFLGWHYTGVPIMNRLGPLRRHRIELHNWISIGALGFALFHGVELMALGDFRGWLSGWIATLLMLVLFVHGWWKYYWVGRWGLRAWRIFHWEIAVAAIAFSLAHWRAIDLGKQALGLSG
jgi:hypothetical protein